MFCVTNPHTKVQHLPPLYLSLNSAHSHFMYKFLFNHISSTWPMPPITSFAEKTNAFNKKFNELYCLL